MNKILPKFVNICYNELEKGGDDMYGVGTLLGKEYFSESNKSKKSISNDDNNTFSEYWRTFTLIKKIVKDSKFDELLSKYIEQDKEIKSGVAIIKGTRISTINIMQMFANGYQMNDILENFPAITNEKQVLAAIVFEVRKQKYLPTLIGFFLGKLNETFMR